MSASLSGASMLAVAAGAAIGAVMRAAAGWWLNDLWHGFPLGTLAVNCVGGLLIGMALIGFEQWPAELPRLFFVTGFLGGLTTFSAFSGESLQLLQRGQLWLAAGHAVAHVFGALACVAVGFLLARLLLRG